MVGGLLNAVALTNRHTRPYSSGRRFKQTPLLVHTYKAGRKRNYAAIRLCFRLYILCIWFFEEGSTLWLPLASLMTSMPVAPDRSRFRLTRMQAITTLPESAMQKLVRDEELNTVLAHHLPHCVLNAWLQPYAPDAVSRVITGLSDTSPRANDLGSSMELLARKLAGANITNPKLSVRMQGNDVLTRLPRDALRIIAAHSRLEALTLSLEPSARPAQTLKEDCVFDSFVQLCNALPDTIIELELRVTWPAPEKERGSACVTERVCEPPLRRGTRIQSVVVRSTNGTRLETLLKACPGCRDCDTWWCHLSSPGVYL